MLVLNSISLFYYNLSCDTSDKPAGVIEDWSKAVVQHATKSATVSTRPISATLVSKKSKKARTADADARFSAYLASDDEHIRIKKDPAPSIQTAANHEIIQVCRIGIPVNSTHLSPQGIVAIAVDVDDESGEGQEAVRGISKKWSNNDLPAGCTENNVWRRVFIPTFFTFLAASACPWTINDEVAAQGLQKIWNMTYHNWPGKPNHFHLVLPQRAVFSIATQCGCEWRASFASAALLFLNAFFAMNKGYETDEARKQFALGQLQNFKFLYEKAV